MTRPSRRMKPEQEVRARHILVETEDEAKKVPARVKGGEDFAKVAGELSKDPGSKTDGGDLGFFTKDRMVSPSPRPPSSWSPARSPSR